MKVQTEVISQGNLFVSPAEFFCGDKVLLSYSFSSTSDAMTELEQFLHGETLTFATSDQLQKIMKFEKRKAPIRLEAHRFGAFCF